MTTVRNRIGLVADGRSRCRLRPRRLGVRQRHQGGGHARRVEPDAGNLDRDRRSRLLVRREQQGGRRGSCAGEAAQQRQRAAPGDDPPAARRRVRSTGTVSAAHSDEGGAGSLIDNSGGVNIVDPGTSGTGYADLQPGSYALVCYIPSGDHVGHLHKGMVAELTVPEQRRRRAGRRPRPRWATS